MLNTQEAMPMMGWLPFAPHMLLDDSCPPNPFSAHTSRCLAFSKETSDCSTRHLPTEVPSLSSWLC